VVPGLREVIKKPAYLLLVLLGNGLLSSQTIQSRGKQGQELLTQQQMMSLEMPVISILELMAQFT
jgi:hypothetical protein